MAVPFFDLQYTTFFLSANVDIISKLVDLNIFVNFLDVLRFLFTTTLNFVSFSTYLWTVSCNS